MIYVHPSVNCKCWLMFSNRLLHLHEKLKYLSKEEKKKCLRSWNGNKFISIGKFVQEFWRFLTYILLLGTFCYSSTFSLWWLYTCTLSLFCFTFVCVILYMQYKCTYMKARGWLWVSSQVFTLLFDAASLFDQELTDWLYWC